MFEVVCRYHREGASATFASADGETVIEVVEVVETCPTEDAAQDAAACYRDAWRGSAAIEGGVWVRPAA